MSAERSRSAARALASVRCSAWFGRDLFVRELREVGALSCVLYCNAANVAVRINIEQRVLVQILGLCDLNGSKLDIQGIGVLKILDLHGTNLRSKKALCTVSPSGSRRTRKYLPCIAWMGAQRRIRPSC